MPLKERKKATYYKLNAKEGEFQKTQKEGDKYVVKETAREYEGVLVGLKTRTYTYKDEEKSSIELRFFSKSEGLETITMGQNNIACSILNKLYSQEDLTNKRLAIRLYEKDGYMNEFVEDVYSGEGLSWGISAWTKMKAVVDDNERLAKFVEDLDAKIDKSEVDMASMAAPVGDSGGDDTGIPQNEKEATKSFYEQAASSADLSEDDVPSPEDEGTTSEEDDDDDLPW